MTDPHSTFQGQCTRCKLKGQVKYLSFGTTQSGPFDRLCAYELKVGNVPIYRKYPKNLFEYIFRMRVKNREIPDKFTMMVFKKRLGLMLASIGITLMLTLALINWLAQHPGWAAGLGLLYFLAAIAYIVLSIEDTSSISKKVNSFLYRELRLEKKYPDRFWLDGSDLNFTMASVLFLCKQVLMLPLYLMAAMFFGFAFGVIIGFMSVIFGGLFAIITVWSLPKKIYRVSIKKFRVLMRIFRQGLFWPRLGRNYQDNFERYWNSENQRGELSRNIHTFILLLALGISYLAYFLFTLEGVPDFFFSVVEGTIDLGYNWLRNAVDQYFALPDPGIILDYIVYILLVYGLILLLIQLIEYLQKYAISYYKKFVVYMSPPDDVISLIHQRAEQTYPSPFNKEVYNRYYWRET